MRAAILLPALLCTFTAQACPADNARPIASLSDLPEAVLKQLGRFEKPQPGIADIGENFNGSDVIYPDSPPQRRLLAGTAAKDCIELKVEFGGFAYHTELLEFRDTFRGWIKTKGSYDAPVLMPAPALAPQP